MVIAASTAVSTSSDETTTLASIAHDNDAVGPMAWQCRAPEQRVVSFMPL